MPPMASSQMIRWSVILQGYDYQLQYRPGSSNHCADALSRLPCEDTLENTTVPFETVHLMQALDRSPVGATEIARLTERDPQLALVKRYIQTGWPSSSVEQVQRFSKIRDELSMQSGVILQGSRVVIPPPAREGAVARRFTLWAPRNDSNEDVGSTAPVVAMYG